jgi:predicted transcriptional regulator
MEYLLPLLVLGLGVLLILVFTPLAWREGQVPTDEVNVSFEQVLEQDLLVEQLRSLENQIQLLKDEYQEMKSKGEPAKEQTPPKHAPGGPAIQQSSSGKLPDMELYREVFQAYDAGKTVTEIAKELGRGKGEIQLILNLRR